MKNKIFSIILLLLAVLFLILSMFQLYVLAQTLGVIETSSISITAKPVEVLHPEPVKKVEAMEPEKPKNESGAVFGKASYYEYTIGEWSSRDHLVAAVRDFPRGSMLLVTNLDNGKSVTIKVTDFGPAKAVHPDRVIDLSPRAFRELSDGTLRAGILKNIKVQLVQE